MTQRPPFIVSTGELSEHSHVYPQSNEALGPVRSAGRAAGLVRMGINLQRLPPGARSSWPHAESDEEEFAYVIEGEVDAWIDGELHRMRAGDLAAFPAGTGICHCFINNTERDALLLVGGEATKPGNRIVYPLNPSRRTDLKAADWWHDAPSRNLGSHDGLSDRLRSARHSGDANENGSPFIRQASQTMHTIVPAVPADAAAIHDIQMRAFAEEGRLSDSLQIPPLMEDVAAIDLHIRTQTVLTARDGDRIIGSARGIVEGSVCTIRGVSVEPDCQGRGIGASLLLAVEQAHPTIERFVLTTNTLVPGNVSFYERHGYQVTELTRYTDKIVLAQMAKAR